MAIPTIRTTSETSRRRPQRHTPAQRRAVLTEMTDEELMKLFQQGTVEAFDLLVGRYSERLSQYLYRFTKDMRRVEDLLQETFLRVYRNRHSYQPVARFSTWLYTIAGNLARSEYRKRKRRRTRSLQAQSRDGEEYELEIPDDTYAADIDAERDFQDQHIMAALSELPDKFREVVVLRDVQQLSYEEIADITGLPMGTVKSRINRGRTKLQGMLADIYPFSQN